MGQTHYGYIHELDVAVNTDNLVITLTGIPVESGSNPFDLKLTHRATHLLWYRLTQILYPHEAPTLISNAGTAPLGKEADSQLATHVQFVLLESGDYEAVGIMPSGEWRIRLTEQTAHRLWALLDVLLYPVGWEGREELPGDDEART